MYIMLRVAFETLMNFDVWLMQVWLSAPENCMPHLLAGSEASLEGRPLLFSTG